MQLAHDGSTGEEVAIKFVPRGSPYLHRAAEREILNHRLLASHAHIVQFREVRAACIRSIQLCPDWMQECTSYRFSLACSQGVKHPATNNLHVDRVAIISRRGQLVASPMPAACRPCETTRAANSCQCKRWYVGAHIVLCLCRCS